MYMCGACVRVRVCVYVNVSETFSESTTTILNSDTA